MVVQERSKAYNYLFFIQIEILYFSKLNSLTPIRQFPEHPIVEIEKKKKKRKSEGRLR